MKLSSIKIRCVIMEAQIEDISRKLSIVIKLLAINSLQDLPTQKEKIILLSSFDLSNPEIAIVLGCTPATVRSTLARERKK